MTVAPGGCTLQLFSIRPKCDGDHRLLPVPRSTIQSGDIYLAPGGGHMAPKPEAARLAYVFGIVLAVAAILAITTLLAAPSSSPI
jgi:hypothetical protein